MRVPLWSVADARLGKMLQAAPSSRSDIEVPYLKSGHLSQWGDMAELPRMWASAADLRRYEIKGGDLVVAEGGDVGASRFVEAIEGPTIFQNSLHRLRLTRPGDIRYLRYGLEALRAEGVIDAMCDKATFGHYTLDKVRRTRLPWFAPSLQTEVADFLDVECARIASLDKELAVLPRLLTEADGALTLFLADHGVAAPTELTDENPWRGLPPGWRSVLLGRALRQLTNGYVGPTRDLLVDEGVRYIQSTHIKDGTIDFDRRPFFVPEAWHAERPRIHLMAGDVLIVQTGKLGEVALVPDSFGPASCHALLIARVDPMIVSGRYLAAYLGTVLGRQSLLRMATGALHPHLEAGEIRKMYVLVPPADLQQQFVERLRAQQDSRRAVVGEADTLRQRLSEYRDALITEAVSGRLDVRHATDAQMEENLEDVKSAASVEVVTR
jgi:type I restriction enzyme S subunit